MDVSAPESAYCVVEAVQNAAPERRGPPPEPQRRTKPRVCSRTTSTLGVGRLWPRREPAMRGTYSRRLRDVDDPSDRMRQAVDTKGSACTEMSRPQLVGMGEQV
jgi:hypothetical protein